MEVSYSNKCPHHVGTILDIQICIVNITLRAKVLPAMGVLNWLDPASGKKSFKIREGSVKLT